MKNWLVQRKKKLELAPRRTWKKYWVCLKGTVLLFFDGDIECALIDENVPRHLLGKILHKKIIQENPEVYHSKIDKTKDLKENGS